jgi:hypothetical protein
MASRKPSQKRAKTANKSDKAKEKKAAARKTEARTANVEHAQKAKAVSAEVKETQAEVKDTQGVKDIQGEVKTVAKETKPDPKLQVAETHNTNNTRDVVPEKTSSATPRRGTMSAKEVTSEVIRNYNTNFVDPWLRAMKSWVSESEKFQQTAVDGLGKALDNGHRLAKESLEMASNIGTTIQKQVAAQVERTTELVQSMIP